MARSATVYACSECGHASPKWHGRCPGCGQWNTLGEEARVAPPASGRGAGPAGGGRAGARALRPVRLGEVETPKVDRLLTGIGELDRVLGGGLVPVLATLEAERPDACVIDSVQVLYDPALSGAPGSVGQVREVAGRVMRVAKERGIATLLVGHVTKEGSLAGPRVLEHLVDCVLSFEGERERTYRTVRALKNRFGSTSEVGVFEMRQGGLVEVADASARFVGEATRAPGSAVLAAMEGSRPLLVEVQALVSPSELVPPRRVCNGIDRNRLALVLAVLGRHAGIGVGTADVFVNVAGGVRVDEPGADLAVALAVASAAKGVVLGDGERPVACFGEVGLTGELRSVGHPDRRLAEAAKFGLRPVIGPPESGAAEAPTLRAALRAALPAAPRA